MDRKFTLTLDVDMHGEVSAEDRDSIIADIPGLRIEVLERGKGHGFGLAEVISVSVLIGSGVASDLAASLVRSGIKAIIRRVRGSQGDTDGTQESIAQLIERERESGETANE
ncbi:hypothetical protein ACFWBI_22905 [Streptomyces sp. NPDC059982]|uniref:hypothetical protein n=1 Tax=unclassified Streptomyces TaxID=2593676 RepID=UPI0036A15A0D